MLLDHIFEMRVRFGPWIWNYRRAIPYWVCTFIVFGPLLLVIQSDQYKGSIIFGNDPFAYFMTNGLFVATLAVGLMYLVNWVIKRRMKNQIEIHR